jgi:hypothetical protein
MTVNVSIFFKRLNSGFKSKMTFTRAPFCFAAQAFRGGAQSYRGAAASASLRGGDVNVGQLKFLRRLLGGGAKGRGQQDDCRGQSDGENFGLHDDVPSLKVQVLQIPFRFPQRQPACRQRLRFFIKPSCFKIVQGRKASTRAAAVFLAPLFCAMLSCAAQNGPGVSR